MFQLKTLLILTILITITFSSPMFYKKNQHDTYEQDLIAVSSTVIPLSVYEVSYGIGGKPSEEYKRAYIKQLYKKMMKGGTDEEYDPDTLITMKKKYYVDKKLKTEKDASVKSL